MIDHLIPYVILFGSIGTGLVAGVFFAFSSFVMKALASLLNGRYGTTFEH
ncbi:hypothetical protein [Heyndrickxia vini]|uniref:Uncharacterized protein n=1 Tax=Heyndrickxia vini TaxID=1476025 RepID=A0ABX7DZJ4_9BACI|nr:hypothetical protein [Heyndrickxia vini]QQZ08470.1 hypothetical protein I5776_15570 [Heyndrickxia vini]